ncbi:MAG: Rrf2 family transcriptional regulator [Candidatus Rokuibacteriota bacterium]|nr:MAG: Rrf2 family transcriptional regulator [Candidatus Rokubacteria bacterium]
MRVSAKGEYAILAVLDLALRRGQTLVPIQDIAERQAIPQRYLEQVLLSLKRAGLLGSRRGSSGGYHLTRPAEQISVGDVLRAVDGAQSPLEAQRRARGRNGGETFDLGELWDEISKAVSEVVDRITFGELAERVRARRSAARPMYHI